MDIFVARQPIFDNRNMVFGYELLYRSGKSNCYDTSDGDQATIDVIRNSFTIIGIDTLTDGKKAFVNFTQNLLQTNLMSVLSPQQVVVEVLEDVVATPEVIAACERIKARGFLLALDDFVWKGEYQPLIRLADIIKVDFIQTERANRAALVQEIGAERVKFLAEKVESFSDYNEAVTLGFKYFQGYFFSKPMLMSARDIPEQKIAYLRIVREICRPDVGFDQLEKLIKFNMSISYKLLRLVNSTAFGLRRPVNSIRYALGLLGLKEIKKWLALIVVWGLGEDKPNELVNTALIRANLGEALAPLVKLEGQKSDLFLMGMFSLIDIMLDRPMIDVLDELPLTSEIRLALLGGQNKLRQVYDLILSYERGEWDSFRKTCRVLEIAQERFLQLYLQTLGFVRYLFSNAFKKY
jgi:c-di-GMP-related signal transduction protein